MLIKLKEILNKANASYHVEYEESHMMNIKADRLEETDSFVYIEEFLEGKYFEDKFTDKKSLRMQIYFCKFGKLETDAIHRQRLRSLIEKEIVKPFMKVYNESGQFEKVKEWSFYYPLPRFDANEVSVMLQFECKEVVC